MLPVVYGVIGIARYIKARTCPQLKLLKGLSVLHIHSLDTTNLDLVKWEASPIDCLKLNVDGAMCSELQAAEVGAIVQDHIGKFILAVSILEANVVNAKSIEVIAILGGL